MAITGEKNMRGFRSSKGESEEATSEKATVRESNGKFVADRQI